MITRQFDLFLNKGVAIAPMINVNQYDHNEQWVFTLYQENGSVYTPLNSAIAGVKSDKKGIINSASVNSNGQVIVVETEQMTAAAGTAIYELVIDDGTHGTANFIVQVEPKPTDGAEISDSDYSYIQDSIDYIAKVKSGLTPSWARASCSYGTLAYTKCANTVNIISDLNITSAINNDGVIATELPVPFYTDNSKIVQGFLVGASSWSRVKVDSQGRLKSQGTSITGYARVVLSYTCR